MSASLVGSEMCIRDRDWGAPAGTGDWPGPARITSTLQRPPQPQLDPDGETASQEVAQDLQRQ
eukprot:4283042-Alexandrium_andersonii.AAC.1